MTLHMINRSPFQHTALSECLKVAASTDAVLLFEDGVYAGLPAAPGHQQLQPFCEQGRCYALQADVEARGLVLSKAITALDMGAWVELCTQHKPIQSWF